MCGILGMVEPSAFGVDAGTFTTMLDAIAHRGPDQSGVWEGEGVLLGHRRLSIIDLTENGRQPMHDATRRVVVVFNGEIYNHRVLRAELTARGYSFIGHSDTEVIPAAYLEWGDTFVERLSGMFAFALWDRSRRRLILARDRFGEKPLYWRREGGALAFTSEMKAMRGAVSLGEDVDALSTYFVLGYIPAPQCAFAGWSKLCPGEMLVFDAATQREERRRYWSLDGAVGSLNGVTYAQAVDGVDRALTRAVAERLEADVPLGVFLSGGIDSSLVAALAAREHPRIRTFSVVHDDPSFDESRYSRMAAEHLGTDHTYLPMQEGHAREVAGDIGALLDEPFADMSLVPTYLLSRLTRGHVTVALGGDGADELFYGYPTHLAHALAGAVDWLPRMVFSGVRRGVDLLPTSYKDFSLDFRLRRFTAGLGLPVLERHFEWQAHVMAGERDRLFAHGALAAPRFPREAEAGFLPGAETSRRVERADLEWYLPGDIMHKVDLASMANALEVRAPYLDHDFARYVHALPVRYKWGWRRTKSVLRTVAERYLPREIVHRSKQGFGFPLGRWLRRELAGTMREALAESELAACGHFTPGYVTRRIEEHVDGRRDNRKLLWAMLVYMQWRRAYL
jgi:asparagine synthase (glutamine-hydrolysing)